MAVMSWPGSGAGPGTDDPVRNYSPSIMENAWYICLVASVLILAAGPYFLQRLLHAEEQAIARKYANCPACGGSGAIALQLMRQHTRLNAVTGALAHHLVLTYLNQTWLTMGVTGGSSSALEPGWHAKLVSQLKQLPMPQVRLRNAAQGFTSQLLTAPCIRTLVGDGVDLLAWEFATNDEYPAVIEAGTAERVRLAEVWMRAAVRLRPKALVFVHFWDRDLEFWEIGKAYPPDKAWVPTNYVADHVLRGQGIDGLSVNMVGMLTSGLMDTAGKKTSFLRDTHHPNDLAFNITADALRLGLLQLWRLGLLTTGADAGGAAADPAAPVAQQPQPLLQPGLLVPVLDQWPVCYLTAQPQFGTAQPELTELGCQAGSNGAGCMLVPYGKAAANRADRKSMMQLPDCAAGDTTSGIVFGVNTTQPLTYLWLSCGAGSDCKGLRVYLDDSVVRSNVDTRPDKFISYFYLWVRNITGTPLQSAKTVRLCRDASGATGDVKVERVLLWVRDGSASMP